MNKKADGGLVIIIVIIIIVIFLGWLINEGYKECRADNDCKENQYCGSDFSCHDLKTVTIERAAPGNSNAPWIIAAGLIVAAIIFKWDSIFGKKDKPKTKKELMDEKQKKLSSSYNAEDEGLYEKEIEDKNLRN